MSNSHDDHHVDVETVAVIPEDAELLQKLHGVRAVNIDAFEQDFGAKMEAAIATHDEKVELKRLERTREQIEQLEDRIYQGKRLAPTRLATLYDRLDELRLEEASILERLSGNVESEPPPVSSLAMKRSPPVQLLKNESTSKVIDSESDTDTDEGLDENIKEDFVDENLGEDLVEDDFSDSVYKARLERWIEESGIEGLDLAALLQKKPLGDQAIGVGATVPLGDFHLPTNLHDRLLDYQRSGVEWLLGLFKSRVGGILGDEMGLGKTVQIIAYLAALQSSGKLNKPVLIICPVTLMKQWIQEFHNWWPPLRVIKLHSSEAKHEIKTVLGKVCQHGHVLITSYGHLRTFKGALTKKDWRAVVLDEGHKIRNPDADITLTCKRLRTAHRLILSGTPIQNSLVELWSLFDFIYPGRLGTLPVFKNEFAFPINAGGYVNASSLQVQTSYRCACILRDMIRPYLLRRVKADVAHELPSKQEQILFCQLTDYQRELYEFILESDIIQSVLAGKRNILAGIDLLRKVCNHPGLLLGGPLEDSPGFPEPFGDISGKMSVIKQTLELWKQRGHKVLLFCQTRQMLDLVESAVGPKYHYLRMDGNTSVKDRGMLVDRFNKDPSIFIFLLTTKVGGLGLNLTGADRVIIYDPDWNPSTDLQARERAWRLGQTKPVTIYRLITAGTIEEKIYHRQLWKQYLTNRVLTDPKQSRFFKSSDLYDLFSLTPPDGDSTETGDLFSGLNLEIRPDSRKDDRTGAKEGEGGDSHILESLFEMTGLHSALHHDRLVERPQQEVMLVQREAERIATAAADALRRSQQTECFDQQQPTWTGRPVQKKNSAPVVQGRVPSSASILATIRSRQGKEKHGGSSTMLDQPLARTLDRLLRFFTDSNGTCRSMDIAERFKDAVPAGQEAAFRQMLKTVATFDPVGRSWHLKQELSNTSTE